MALPASVPTPATAPATAPAPADDPTTPGPANAPAAAPAAAPAGPPPGLARRARAHWANRHYRNGYYLMLNSLTGAAAGLLFWLVVVRFYAFPVRDIGIGLAAVSMATAIALVAKGGLDAAIVRHVPNVDRRHARHLLELAIATGLLLVAAIVVLLGALPWVLDRAIAGLEAAPLALLGGLAALLVVTWLQDAQFLAAGEARFSFYRNLVLHAGRLVAPALVVALALPFPVPMALALALLASIAVAQAFMPRLPRAPPAPEPARVPARVFLRTARRNVAGSAAEFLPGLLLAPLVLVLEGSEAAAHFGIAWTGASLLFLLSAAIGRSTFAELSRAGGTRAPLRQALRQHLLIVAPAALAALVAAPWLLGLFGASYAAHGWPVFALLVASIVLVAPVYLCLALLRARDDQRALLAFPLALLAALAVLAPALEARFGLVGIGYAWIAAHAPLAIYASQQLRTALRAEEVDHAPAKDAPAHGGRAHVE